MSVDPNYNHWNEIAMLINWFFFFLNRADGNWQSFLSFLLEFNLNLFVIASIFLSQCASILLFFIIILYWKWVVLQTKLSFSQIRVIHFTGLIPMASEKKWRNSSSISFSKLSQNRQSLCEFICHIWLLLSLLLQLLLWFVHAILHFILAVNSFALSLALFCVCVCSTFLEDLWQAKYNIT